MMSYLTDKELLWLQEKYCKTCEIKRCSGMFDETYREGCLFYVRPNEEAHRKFLEEIRLREEQNENLRKLQ